jgi:hypothetical protein
MREELEKFHGERRRFQGEFIRYGQKRGWKHPLTTIVLRNVIDVKTGRIVTDHLWFTQGKQFERLYLEPGDIVSFTARVTKYLKGYQGRRDEYDDRPPVEIDCRLSYPAKLEKKTIETAHNSTVQNGTRTTLDKLK